MPTHVAGALGSLLASSMQRAQGHDAPVVVGELETALGTLAPGSSPERAATLYVLAVAHLMAEEPDRTVGVAATCIRIGEDLAEPGWVANALGVRAVALDRLGRAAEAVDDLVRAEWELGLSDDLGLVAWAHAGLGTAYEELRLFELAAPHYQRCFTLRVDPMDFPSSELIDELSLASLHGTWAREREMLGHDGGRAAREIAALRTEALAHAERAISLRTDDTFDHLVLRARLLRAQNGWHGSPDDWVDELVELRARFSEVEDDGHAVECTATLSAILAAAGRHERAAEEAERAVDVLGEDADLALDRYVRWVYLTVQQLRGERSAASGLAFGATVARSWWSHRDNKLEMMRSAIAGYGRYRTSEVDRVAARQDPLTGLGNRRAYDEWLETHDVDEPATLVLLDVDGLKLVNDTFGHQAGDDLLGAIARMLTAHTRDPDLTLRLGGDEFVVVVRGADEDEGRAVVDRIRSALVVLRRDASRPFLTGVSASIRLASTLEGLPVTGLLGVADARMYEDKRRQREQARERVEDGVDDDLDDDLDDEDDLAFC